MHRSICIVPVLTVMLVAGCSGQPETVAEQNVAVCISADGDVAAAGRMDVEFRQGGEVVATGSAMVGGVVGARVPTGEIDVYVNGELYGHVASYGPGLLDEEGKLQGSTYLSGPGCPSEAPIG